MRIFLYAMALVSFVWGIIGAFITAAAIYRRESEFHFIATAIVVAPWVGVMVTGSLLFTAAEVLGYVQRRMRQMDAEDQAVAARARARKHAEKVAKADAKRAAKAAKRAGKDGPIDFQILDGGDQRGGN